MSEKEIEDLLKAMEKYKKKIIEYKEEDSLKLLVKAGICDSKGNLEPQYR